MNNGIKILSERMVESPSDFREPKWRRLVVRVIENRGSIFTDEECDLINDSVIQLERRLFEGDVMQALAPPPPVTTQGNNGLLVQSHAGLYDENEHRTLSEMVERAVIGRMELKAAKARIMKGQTVEEKTECTTV
jgi:hypothetical protein